MKKYKVISPYAERFSDGTKTGKYIDKGETVTLSDSEAERLTTALCVEEIEVRTVEAPENRSRKRGRPRKGDSK